MGFPARQEHMCEPRTLRRAWHVGELEVQGQGLLSSGHWERSSLVRGPRHSLKSLHSHRPEQTWDGFATGAGHRPSGGSEPLLDDPSMLGMVIASM